ncbi:MAG: FHIPEP family type III secretion protein, partial [Pseudomonadota bacterium]
VGGSKDKPDQVIFSQLSDNPNTLGLSGLVMLILAIIPGLPALPFLLFATLAAIGAYFRYHMLTREASESEDEGDKDGMHMAHQSEEAGQETIAETLEIDKLRLEMGYSLLSLINEGDFQLTDQIRALRRQVASDFGFVMPAIRIQDNLNLSSNEYCVVIKEIEAGKGTLRPNMYLAMGSKESLDTIPGEHTKEPTYGLPAKWISETTREDAIFAGLTVVDCATVISTHLTELIKEHMAELLSYAETRKLLQELPEDYEPMVKQLLPDRDSTALVQRVLQNLLSEQVSIRDVPTIVEAIGEAVGFIKNVQMLTEHVRSRLARSITESCSDSDGILRLISVSGEWERAFVESLAGEGEDQYLAMAPSTMQDFLNQVRTVHDNLPEENANAVILCGAAIRPFVRSVLARFMPHLQVLSENEIYPKAKIRTIASI